MIIRFTEEFYTQYKKADVRIRNQFNQQLEMFKKNMRDPQLRNHPLKDKYQGYRSINVTADWRAIYREEKSSSESVIYFSALGTHSQLYR